MNVSCVCVCVCVCVVCVVCVHGVRVCVCACVPVGREYGMLPQGLYTVVFMYMVYAC